VSVLDELDLSSIADERVRQGLLLLLNLVEELKRENAELRAENQRLRDEINRLKGEQGKPTIKGNAPKPPPTPPGKYSSEKERRTPREWAKGPKSALIQVDREQTLEVDRTTLPEDAQFKGHADVVVQDVVLHTDNVLFHKEKFYSPSAGQSYLAPLPAGYAGQFGPGIKALTIVLAFGANVSEPKILELYRNVGVVISAGQVSNFLIKEQEVFHTEKAAVHQAGLASSPWQHLDETSTRVNGENQFCQVTCNPLYTSYHTTDAKDRQTILDVLRNGRPRAYLLNAEADRLLSGVLSGVAQKQVGTLPREERLDEVTLLQVLDERASRLGPHQRKWVLDAAAVAAYHAEVGFPVVKLLICDDAPQFTWLTEELALCWVHEARHYNKLLPCYPPFQKLLAEFLDPFWDYYDALLAYREHPTPTERDRLWAQFDDVFVPTTGYRALDDRIAKTTEKKVALLLVLAHPEIPLHNNPAELGARQRVRKRDVSFGPRTGEGSKAWDTFMTLAATTKKLGVSFYAYVHDRLSIANQIAGLDRLIAAQAETLNLGPSWNTS
jgi:Transposase IS66 family